jgi:hypothetical protein
MARTSAASHRRRLGAGCWWVLAWAVMVRRAGVADADGVGWLPVQLLGVEQHPVMIEPRAHSALFMSFGRPDAIDALLPGMPDWPPGPISRSAHDALSAQDALRAPIARQGRGPGRGPGGRRRAGRPPRGRALFPATRRRKRRRIAAGQALPPLSHAPCRARALQCSQAVDHAAMPSVRGCSGPRRAPDNAAAQRAVQRMHTRGCFWACARQQQARAAVVRASASQQDAHPAIGACALQGAPRRGRGGCQAPALQLAGPTCCRRPAGPLSFTGAFRSHAPPSFFVHSSGQACLQTSLYDR